MTKEEYLKILILISHMEGYMIGIVGKKLPEYLNEDLAEVCDLLAKHIRGDQDD